MIKLKKPVPKKAVYQNIYVLYFDGSIYRNTPSNTNGLLGSVVMFLGSPNNKTIANTTNRHTAATPNNKYPLKNTFLKKIIDTLTYDIDFPSTKPLITTSSFIIHRSPLKIKHNTR